MHELPIPDHSRMPQAGAGRQAHSERISTRLPFLHQQDQMDRAGYMMKCMGHERKAFTLPSQKVSQLFLHKRVATGGKGLLYQLLQKFKSAGE